MQKINKLNSNYYTRKDKSRGFYLANNQNM